ncbi:response regulator, partial [bacterium]|nr:response regulator [bacterium]
MNCLFSQAQTVQFKHVPFDEGFSKKTILCILQDHKGFMWFGTLNGLYKYDGYQFVEYLHDSSDPYSLSNNDIYTMYEDREGILWIGTNDAGLNRYNRDLDRFIRYQHDPADPASISNDRIMVIREDAAGYLWIGTQQGGLNCFDKTNGTSVHFRHAPGNRNSLSYDDVRHLHIDQAGILWIGTEHGGLNRFNPETEQFIHYTEGPNNGRHLLSDRITSLFPDNTGLIWVGTEKGMNRLHPLTGHVSIFNTPEDSQGFDNTYVLAACADLSGTIWLGTEIGLYHYNPATESFIFYKHEAGNPKSLIYDCVISAYEDRSGVLWFGTWDGGLCNYNPGTSRFGHVKHLANNPGSLNDNRVNVIFEDSKNNLWIGTEKGGLNRQLPQTSYSTVPQFIHYVNDPQNPHSLNWNTVSALCEDKSGRLWVGTTEQGLSILNPATGEFTPFPLDRFDFRVNAVSALLTDRSGNIWIGSRNGGALLFQPSTNKARIFYHEPDGSGTLISKGINCIYEDRSGTFWIGTMGGLTSLKFCPGDNIDQALDRVKHYQADPHNKNSLSNKVIRVIFEDRTGHIWIGTNGGLNRLDRESGQITRYLKKDGLSENVINGIAEDEHGNLWISTNNGLSRLNLKTSVFKNFDINDGLQGNDFRWGAIWTGSDGKLYFGGSNGYNAFFPIMPQDSIAPPVVITGFSVLNEPVGINEIIEDHVVLTRSITEVDQISLSYKSRVFSFEFAALDFRDSGKNQYAYILEGFEDKWTNSGRRRFAAYTNLDGGEYTFRVKAANKDGIWNEQGATVVIKITPPWWKTVWAHVLFILAGLILLFLIARFWTNKERIKNQLHRERLEADKWQELDQMKSRFFANISHEFRTPLSLILGSAKRLKSGEMKQNIDSQYDMQIRNSERLLNLVNELMDLSKIEAGKLELHAAKASLSAAIMTLMNAFEGYAAEQSVELNFNAPEKDTEFWFDPVKIDKIFINLISNAIKFTSAGGHVEVCMTVEDKAEITVRDNGRGIASEHLPHVFDRFYQAGEDYVKNQAGSGIGLALTRELVLLHHGEITAESKAGKGSTFTVRLPLGDEHLKAEEKVQSTSSSIPAYEERLPLISSRETAGDVVRRESIKSVDSTIILIVEDNDDMRAYIRDILAETYQIEEAADGEQGFEKAAECIPDLIISDVMMPKMDGYQLCKKLKTDQRTSHIPVVLLTAKSSGESKMEGLELGADDYLTKPF